MSRPRPADLVLGTVQLGIAYGIANRVGKPSRKEAVRLLTRAATSGITQIDTARAYGDSEECLGEAIAENPSIRIITKLSPLAELAADAAPDEVRDYVDMSIDASLRALRRTRIDCLLLHRASHLHAYGGAIWERLIELRKHGTIGTLGVSAQSPRDVLAALDCSEMGHIQLPFNLLDWRWRTAQMAARVAACPHVTIHARSVFLQGLLALNDSSLWPRVPGVDAPAVALRVHALAGKFGRISAADLCLAYVRAQSWIDGVVVGMETEQQLDDNLRLFARAPLSRAECATIDVLIPRLPEQLLDPSRWQRSAA